MHSHLADVEERAQELFLRLVEELAAEEGVTERLKAENSMDWVAQMNNIRNRAEEIVKENVVFEG